MGEQAPVIAALEWRQGGYVISDDQARLDLEATCTLLGGTYRAGDRSSGVMRDCIANSLSFGLFEGARQIGFARVITDFATMGYLCDVVIEDGHRGEGLGKWMLSTILAHPRLATCRMDLFTHEGQDFYRQHGFGPHRFTSMVRYPGVAE